MAEAFGCFLFFRVSTLTESLIERLSWHLLNTLLFDRSESQNNRLRELKFCDDVVNHSYLKYYKLVFQLNKAENFQKHMTNFIFCPILWIFSQYFISMIENVFFVKGMKRETAVFIKNDLLAAEVFQLTAKLSLSWYFIFVVCPYFPWKIS